MCLTDKILGLDKGERIDKKVKAELIKKASEQSYSRAGKLVVPKMEISATTVMRNVRKNDWKMEIKERKEEEKIKAKNIFIQVDENYIKERKKRMYNIKNNNNIYVKENINKTRKNTRGKTSKERIGR